jgi:aquaporin Z
MNRFDIVQRAEGDEESAGLLSSINTRGSSSESNIYQQMAAEAIGVLFLTAAIAMGVDAAGIGSMLAVMIFALGHVSGAHLNPAVTLAVFIRGKIGLLRGGLYMVAQTAGAFLGGLVAKLILDDIGSKVSYPKVGDDVSVIIALLVEALFTLALATVVLNVATTKANAGNSYFGLAIGLTVTAAAKAGGSISGGAFNPAVGLALPIFREYYSDIWIYAVGPLVGGALAGGLFRFTAKGNEF